MFIRRTQTRNTTSGETYHTHRLVRSARVDGKVKQLTLLNLGRHFDLDQTHWPALCVRLEELLAGQVGLLPAEGPAAVERHAQRIAAQLLARGQPAADIAQAPSPVGDVQTVDVDSLFGVAGRWRRRYAQVQSRTRCLPRGGQVDPPENGCLRLPRTQRQRGRDRFHV
jgi:hypothetical protein